MSLFMSPQCQEIFNTIDKNKEKAINIECFSNCKHLKSHLFVSAADLSISIVNCLVLKMQLISVSSAVGIWSNTGPPVNHR